MSDENGQPNGNGNGAEKPFYLAKHKTPEEIAQENLRKTMPQIRRAVYQMRLAPAAKFLFGSISDDSFMADFGGDGFGTIITTIKDMARRFKHDRESIGKWLQFLIEKEVVWMDFKWPYLEIHISAIVPPPKHKASAIQRIRARASAKRNLRCVEPTDTPLFLPKSGETTRKSEETRKSMRVEPASDVEPTDTSCGTYRHMKWNLPTENDRQTPHVVSEDATRRGGRFHTSSPEDATRRGGKTGSGDEVSSMVAGKTATLERSPSVKNGEKEDSLSVQRVNASSGGPVRKAKNTVANAFLKEVEESMELWQKGFGKKELSSSGAWWRKCFNENPDKAVRVLADIRAGIKEGRVFSTNPGAAAVDTWRRFA